MVRSEVRIGGRGLAATVFAPGGVERPGPGVLFVHGSGGDRSSYAHRAEAVVAACGAVCLTVDLSGNGESRPGSGPWTIRDHLDDLLAAHSALAEDPRVDPDRIGACGASYGGYLVGLLAAHRPLCRLVLRAPALYRDDDGDRPGPALAAGPSPATADFFAGLRSSGAAVLVVESERDEVIPHGVIAAYVRETPGAELAVLPGAAHGLTQPAWDRRFVELTADWFRAL